MKYNFFSLLASFLLFSCGNVEYFEEIAIPARQSARGDYGLVNLKGELVVDFLIDEKPSLMVNGIAQYKDQNGQIVFINTNGDEIKTSFKEALHFNEEKMLVRREDGKLAFINKDLQEIMVVDDAEKASNFSEGLFKFENEDGLWGFKDINGTTIIKPRYDKVNSFREGVALVYQNIDDELQIGFINKIGNIVFPFSGRYQEINDFSNGLATFKKNDFIGALNKNFEEVFKNDEWREIYSFQGEHTTVKGKDKEFGLIDQEGEYLIKTREKLPLRFYNDLALFYDIANSRGGFFDINRNIIIRPEFTEGLPFFSDGAWVKDGRQWAYIDSDGNDIKSGSNLNIRNLFHESFSKSILKKNTAIDLDESITSTFYNLESVYEFFLDPNTGVIFDDKETMEPSYFDNLYKKYISTDLYNSLTDNNNLILALPKWQKQMDSYLLFNSNLEFDKNFQFRLSHTFAKPIRSEENNTFSNLNELKSVKLNLSLKNKAKNKGSEVIERITSLFENDGFELVKNYKYSKALESNDKSKNLLIKRKGNYFTILLTYSQ